MRYFFYFLCGSVAFIGFVGNASSAVTSFGSVDPDPNVSGGSYSGEFRIGYNDNSVLQGYVGIDEGTLLQSGKLIVGETAGSVGLLEISGNLGGGNISKLSLGDNSGVSNPTVQIGDAGIGEVRVRSGGILELTNSGADLVVGKEVTGAGTLVVEGTFSQVMIPDDQLIGDDGVGRMYIFDGGVVNNLGTSSEAIIGNVLTGKGEVFVDGIGSIWNIRDDLKVGEVGTGTLTISNDGLVSSDSLSIGRNGRVMLEEGTLNVISEAISNEGFLGGSGLVLSQIDSQDEATIKVSEGDLLRLGTVFNDGTTVIEGGELEILNTFVNQEAGGDLIPGRITFENGTLRVTSPLGNPLQNDGVMAFLSGTNHVHGRVLNGEDGAIVLASNSLGTFYHPVEVSDGSLDLLYGANALFLDDLTYDTGSQTLLQLNTNSNENAQISVSGSAVLDGDLEVEIIGTAPQLGDSYTLLTAAGGVVGTFDNESVPTLDPGLAWSVEYGADNIVLEVVASPTGDFDGDTLTTGLDFLAWQRGESPIPFSKTDLDNWEQDYAQGTPLSQGLATLPEPTSGAITLLMFLGATFLRSKR